MLLLSQSLEAITTVRRHGRPFRSSRTHCDVQRCRLAGSILIEVMLPSGSGARPVELRNALPQSLSMDGDLGDLRQDQRLVSLLVSLLRLGYLDVVYSAPKDLPT